MPAPALLSLVPFLLGLFGNMQALVPPFCNWSAQSLFSIWPNGIPDPSYILDWVHRGIIEESEYYTIMKRLGLKHDYAERMIKSTKLYLQMADYIQLYRRGALSEEQLKIHAQILKVDEHTVYQMMKVTELLPGPSDLVRFAVREVFTPQIVDEYGLYDDYPPKFEEEGAKIGMSPETCLNNWAAHWQLPSLNMGYEMFHRRIIDSEGLKTLMRTQDVMPYWRDKLIKMSYKPLTRVDVQRMYELGILDEDDVTLAYRDLGYNPANAEAMTEFTKVSRGDDYKNITRSNIVSSYVDDIITKEEMIFYFDQLRFSDEEKSFWISNADYKKAEKIIANYSNKLINDVRLGNMSLDELRSDMARNEIPDSYIQKVVDEILDSKALNEKLPTKADLLEWIQNGIIDDRSFSYYMRLRGYTDTVILNYLTQLTIDLETSKRKFLKDDIYIRWLKDGIMTQEQFVDTLQKKGIKDADIKRYLLELKSKEEEK